MRFKFLLIKLANQLDELGLYKESNVIDSILIKHSPGTIIKNSCIIASGNFDKKKCLFKNRDRTYNPQVTIHHTIINGVEIAYMKDEVTSWVEGLNEFGIGIINAALEVGADEREGHKKIKKEKNKDKDEGKDKDIKNKKIKEYPINEKRMLVALSQKDIKSAAKIIARYADLGRGGLIGHNIIADPHQTIVTESTKNDKVKVLKLDESKKHVRTNHGIFYEDAGYGPEDGASYYSSHARLEQAEEILKSVKYPDDIAPAIYGKRFRNLDDPMNMVRSTKKMNTSNQLLLNLTDLELILYNIPDKVKFLGYKKDLPEGYEPKITVKVLNFSKLDEDKNFKITEQKI